jgi:hypothetical protein
MAQLSRKLIGLAFYKTDNHKDFDCNTFDDIYNNPKLIVRMLQSLDDEEYHTYYFPEDADILQDDYNNEVLDCGGWWMVPLYETEKHPKKTYAVVEYTDKGFGRVTYKDTMDEAMAIFNARRDEYAKCEVETNQESRVPLSLYGLDENRKVRHVEIIFVEGKEDE